MGEAIDLSRLFDTGTHVGAAMKPIDSSGLPRPTRAIATLANGIQVECVVQYCGVMNRNKQRRYRVAAELDWATANVVSVGLDRWPRDVLVTMKVPDEWPDVRCHAFAHAIQWYVLS